MSIKNILKLLILCIVLASSIGIASAEAPPTLPMGLYGDVKIGGSPAPKDTKIEGKIGSTVVATTYVINSGKYGDNSNYLGISAPNEGDDVDLYVNGVFVTTVKYNGKSTGVDLNAPEKATSAGTSGSSGGSGSSEGSVGGSGDVIKPTTTAPQSAVNSIQSEPGVTATKENTVAATKATSTSEPAFNFYTILGVFAVIAVIGILLKKSGKI
ncbi:MAG: hypothetical protein OIN86_04830 [Candidatus Methanoperedens sp.]|nr:hypothetical protein [Candidatus Methanoperedens sp.]CAG0978792.1 hypothetical protein METP1_01652 [Methanosarcinales archaeon]